MIVDETQKVWYKKYVPQVVEDIVLPADLKAQIQQYVDEDEIPHLGLFSSEPGTGKTSTAQAIIKELGCEALWINASLDRGVDLLRGKIGTFASQTSFDGGLKVVVMDEFDSFSDAGQKAFRGFIDEYSENCRFIFTGNYKSKIIPPLLDRLEVYDFNAFVKENMLKPIFNKLRIILEHENIEYDPKDLVPVINTYYPSIRSMIGALQKFSGTGTFKASIRDLDNVDVFDSIMKHVLKKTFGSVIQEVNMLSAPDNMYTFLYKNTTTYYQADKQPQVLMIIAKYQHMSGTVRDKHLNLSACLTELMKTI